MKYLVEVQRVSFITMTIEADMKEDAEAKAWKEVEQRGDSNYADWNITLMEEVRDT